MTWIRSNIDRETAIETISIRRSIVEMICSQTQRSDKDLKIDNDMIGPTTQCSAYVANVFRYIAQCTDNAIRIETKIVNFLLYSI